MDEVNGSQPSAGSACVTTATTRPAQSITMPSTRTPIHQAMCQSAATSLSTADDRVPGGATMVAQVPIGHIRTIYSQIGDLFAWLRLAGMATVVIAALVQPR